MKGAAARVAILVRRTPVGDSTTEALRVALGMTLADHQVTIVYLDDGAGAAGELGPGVAEDALSLLGPCHVRQVVDAASLERARVARARDGVELVDRAKALAVLGETEALVSW
jgi:hypothetical protein